MPEYTLTKCSPLGDRDQKYGQRYWSEALESNVPLSFNSLGDIHVGAKITYETMAPKTSKKGNEYMQLYKVKQVGSVETPKEADDRIGQILKYTQALYHKFITDDGLVDVSEPEPAIDERGDDSAKGETVLDDIDEEKINLDSIPF